MLLQLLAACDDDDAPPEASQPAGRGAEAPRACDAPGPLTYTDQAAPWGLTGLASDNEEHLNGGGAALADFDGDGDLDALLAYTDAPLTLYTWQGDHFTPTEIPVGRTLDTGTVLPVDVEGDGDFDVFVGGATAGETFLRNTGGVLTEEPTWVPKDLPFDGMQGPAAADVDGDGDVDLYVPLYTILPDERTDRLLRNGGDGVMAVEALPATVGSKTYQALFFDADADGDPDAYATNDQGPDAGGNVLFRNDDGAFTSVPSTCAPATSGMSVDSADVNGDGLADLYLGNSDFANLYYADGTGDFYDVARAVGAGNALAEGDHDMVWGEALFDAENDGDIDIFAAHGDLYSPHDAASAPYDAPDSLLLQADGTFTEVAPALGLDSLDSGRAVVPADWNGDGVLDLLVTGAVTEPHLWVSDTCTAGAWLDVDLVGVTDNLHGLGARVEVEAGGRTFTAWATSAASLFSGRAPRVHVGLGDADTIDRLTVHWSSGAEQTTTWAFAPNRRIVVTQE